MYTSSVLKYSLNIIITEIIFASSVWVIVLQGKVRYLDALVCSVMASEYIDLVPSLNMVWQKTAHFSEQLRVWAMFVPPQIPAHTPIRASVAEKLTWWRTFLRKKQAK